MFKKYFLKSLYYTVSQLRLPKQKNRKGGLYNRYLFLTIQEAGKSTIKVPWIEFSMRALFGCCRCLSLSCILTWKKGNSSVSSSTYKDTNAIMGVWSSWAHLNLNTPKSPISWYHYIGARASTYEFGENTFSP